MVQDENCQFVEKKTTKTPNSTRSLTVLPNLAERLAEVLENGGMVNTYNPSHICQALEIICRNNGLPKMTLHDLRRQNASVMLSLGIADKYAMERGGWSSPSVMKNIYQMTMSDKRKNVDSVVNSYFESLITR